MEDDKKKQEHKFWVNEEIEEGNREKKKAQQFYKDKIKRTGFSGRALMEGKMIHGIEGKPGRGTRGNKRG
ncbi:MAG: hypothetical protein V2A72_07065 [Candidatus Omnitrophota bacterium]